MERVELQIKIFYRRRWEQMEMKALTEPSLSR